MSNIANENREALSNLDRGAQLNTFAVTTSNYSNNQTLSSNSIFDFLNQEIFSGYSLKYVLVITVVTIVAIYILYNIISNLRDSYSLKIAVKNWKHKFLNNMMSIIEYFPFLNIRFNGRYPIYSKTVEIV